MKNTLLLSLAAVVIAAGSGCSIIDRLFLLNADGPYAHGGHPGGAVVDGGCPDGQCVQPAGYTETCTDGTCNDGACANGAACGPGGCGPGGCGHGACGHHGAGLLHGGCHGRHCRDGSCHACRDHFRRYGGLARHKLSPAEKAALGEMGQIGPAGPPTGGVAYPYYTTRGPRDFLAKCPPSIGP